MTGAIAPGTTEATDEEPGPPRRIRVIWNAGAGMAGRTPARGPTEDELRALLARHGLGDELIASESAGEARSLAAQAAREGYDLVVAAGGDGTIGNVAEQLLETSTALGVLPLGSVMNIPRSLGLPRDLEAAAAILAEGAVATIDVGEVEGRPFYEAGSVGMNAAMFKEARRFDRGDWSSIVRTVWVAFRYRPARMTIRLDDRVVKTRALMVTIANGPYTGVAMTVAPAARLDDGRFDVTVFRRFSKPALLRHLAGIAFGRYRPAPELATHRSARVEITSVHPLPARADARDLGHTPVTFTVRPAALRVVVPRRPAR